MKLKKMIKTEKDYILSDPLISAVVELEARKVGVSVEEYIDKFLEVFYNSNNLLPIINADVV